MADLLYKRKEVYLRYLFLREVLFLAATWGMISFIGKDGYLQQWEVQNNSSVSLTMKLEESY